jgi:hypothetical protein
LKPFILIFFLSSLLATAGKAQTFTGTVTNGTTKKPAGGDEVTLIRLLQGMEEVATTKTNGRGEFKISGGGSSDPKAGYMIRVRHAEVNYHEPLPEGRDNIQITVYDSAAKVAGLRLLEQSEVVQAQGSELQIIELFRINNSSAPPLTQPTFEFYLPKGANVRMGQGIFEGRMPVKSTPVPQKESDKYALLFPVRPGNTQFEVVYTIPYQGSISIQPKLAMDADHYYVVTAKGINFSAQGGAAFQAMDQWPTDTSITGVDVHAIAGARAGQALSYQLSGAGVLGDSTAQSQSAPRAQEDNRPGGGLGVPNERPDPLHSQQWLFLGVLTLFLAAGATYVYSWNHPAAAPAPSNKPQDRTGLLLEAMKEEIFQLETDRLQGKISAKDYESAKAALDKTLQRAVQRQRA